VREIPAGLPGRDLFDAGLQDLADGRESEEALLVALAAPRLRAIGLEIPAVAVAQPSHRLYELLSDRDPADAHSRYNALVRRIVSFSRAMEHAASG
jgi:hypothetical protein